MSEMMLSGKWLLLWVGVEQELVTKTRRSNRRGIRSVVGDRILMSNCTAVAGWIGKEGVDVKVNRSGGPGRRDCSLFPLPCPGLLLLSCLYFRYVLSIIHSLLLRRWRWSAGWDRRGPGPPLASTRVAAHKTR